MAWLLFLGFMALIIAYCLWAMFGPSADLDPAVAQLLEELGEDTGALVDSLAKVVYSAVIAGTVIFQGLNARYYYVRVAQWYYQDR